MAPGEPGVGCRGGQEAAVRGSDGLPALGREFIEQHYVTLKQANPDFPILIRECSGVQPRLWARYGECSAARSGLGGWTARSPLVLRVVFVLCVQTKHHEGSRKAM